MSQLRGGSQVKWGSTRKIRTTDRQYNKRPPGHTDNCDFKSEQSLSPSPVSVCVSFSFSFSRATGSFFFSYFSLALAHSNDIVGLLAAGEERLSMKWLALNPPCQWCCLLFLFSSLSLLLPPPLNRCFTGTRENSYCELSLLLLLAQWITYPTACTRKGLKTKDTWNTHCELPVPREKWPRWPE